MKKQKEKCLRVAIDLIGITRSGSAGGAAYLALVLAKGLAARCEVIALCDRQNREYLREVLPKDVPVVAVMSRNPSIRYNFVTAELELLKEYITIHTTLSHLSYDVLFCPLSVPTCYRRKIPMVATIHDLQHEFYPQFFGKKEVAARRKIYRHLVARASRLASVSDYTRDTFCQLYHYPKERITTIYNSIQNRFGTKMPASVPFVTIPDMTGHAGKAPAPRKLSAGSYLIYPANFWENKNHRRLLEAFAAYCSGEQQKYLLLTGSELDRGKELRQLAQELGIADQVIFAGHVSDEQMGTLLRNAKGLIYPSLYEGFGIPVAEAMYMDIPVACSSTTSLPEVAGKAAFYFNPEDTEDIRKGIAWLFSVTFTPKMREAYQQQLKKFSYDTMIEKYYTLLEVCVRANERARGKK